MIVATSRKESLINYGKDPYRNIGRSTSKSSNQMI
uniref:Uncharacterized protein n=2 Tax=Lepeophtheirus salmonis TaxID=72036 RepID=A0A0K2UAH1_LEPSM